MHRIFFFLCLILQHGTHGTDFMGMKVRELPESIRDEFVKIFMKTLDFIHTCNSSDTEEIQYQLYNRNHPKQPIILDPSKPSEVEEGKTTVLIMHGWISNANSQNIPAIRDAYLKKHDYNVIMVDWSKTAATSYSHAFCALPVIAEHVANLLCLLDAEYNVPLDMIHLVGHSLGGQMSGLIGQNTMKICHKPVDRITALDPAGPLFFGLPESNRLDASDANFVQVIHTNGGVFGYLTQCGDLDFFVNCGVFQRGCITLGIDIFDTLVSDVTCSHSRSQEYMAESIYNEDFVGNSCKFCPATCIADVFHTKTAVMGENASRKARSNFLVTTAPSSPFAKKCNSYTYGVCL